MKRGVKTCFAGIGFLAVGLVVFVTLFLSLARGGAGETQHEAPGSFNTSVSEPGRYYLWDNYRTVFEGRRIDGSRGFPKDMDVSVQNPDGEEVDFTFDDGNSWSVGNHAKASVGYVDVQGPGELQFNITGSSDKKRIVSFSQSTLRQAMGKTFLWLGVSVTCGLVGAAVTFVGLVRFLFCQPKTKS